MTPPHLERLGLDGAADERAIRRAYARELKLIDQDQDAAGFQILREAYEAALQWVRHRLHIAETPVPNFASANAQVTPVDVRRRGPTAESAHVARAAVDESARDAESMFADFTARCQLLVGAEEIYDDVPWQKLLQEMLTDRRLDNLRARELFEFRILQRLTGGWKEGHQALFVAAGKVLNWNTDRRKLIAFGPTGMHMDRAINEHIMFQEQASLAQKHCIALLRSPVQPTLLELIHNMVFLEQIAARFPNWFAMVTSVEHLIQWRELNRNIPVRVRRKILRPKGLKRFIPRAWYATPRLLRPFLLIAPIVLLAFVLNKSNPPVPTQRMSTGYSRSAEIPTVAPLQTLRNKLVGNIRFVVPPNLAGNPSVAYLIELDWNGRVLSLKKDKASGNMDFDNAVSVALMKSQPFSSDLPRKFFLTWHMKTD